jgi:hypothetical protein
MGTGIATEQDCFSCLCPTPNRVGPGGSGIFVLLCTIFLFACSHQPLPTLRVPGRPGTRIRFAGPSLGRPRRGRGGFWSVHIGCPKNRSNNDPGRRLHKTVGPQHNVEGRAGSTLEAGEMGYGEVGLLCSTNRGPSDPLRTHALRSILCHGPITPRAPRHAWEYFVMCSRPTPCPASPGGSF